MPLPKSFAAYINPLIFLPFDDLWKSHLHETMTLESLLNCLCNPSIDPSVESVISRYNQISQEPSPLVAAPAEDNILNKLVWPLRQAKVSYVLGNYLGTIASCGMVCEMLAILLFDISDSRIDGRPLDKSAQSALFGRPFENLGQERRLSVLRSYNLIDDDLKSSLDLVRDKRRRYLHFFSQEHSNIQTDSIQVYYATIQAVVKIIGQDVADGMVSINPRLLAYLEAKGLAGFDSQSQSS